MGASPGEAVRNGCWTVLLLVGLAAGCTLPAHVKAPSWIEGLRSGAVVDPNVVLIETALIERPIGDSYINRELWQGTDEAFLGLTLREALRDNGLRVGQIVGSPPAGFQTLLLSPRCCSNPTRLMVPTGRTIPVYLSPTVLPHSSFDVVVDGERSELEVDQARFGFDLTATLTNDGRTRLALTPKVETGETLLPFRASPEESRWVLRVEKPCRSYPRLGWEVTLKPGQYLVVGCLPDLSGSLGQAALVQADGANPVQRLLVIRTNRAGGPADALASEGLPQSGRAAPLALQASVPNLSGTR